MIGDACRWTVNTVLHPRVMKIFDGHLGMDIVGKSALETQADALFILTTVVLPGG